MRARLIRIAILSVIALPLSAGIAWWINQDRFARGNAAGGDAGIGGFAGSSLGGPYALTDHTGQAVTQDTFQGSYQLIYFGFTYCPDVCPTELWRVAQVMDALGESAERVQPILITVDPERDTPEALAQYVGLFHPRMVGLTGSAEQIADVAAAYRVFYMRAPLGESGNDESGDYLMDHSSFTYGLGPDGEVIRVFTPTQPIEEIAEFLQSHMDGSA